MAKIFLTNINLKGNQLLNAVMHSASTPPTALAVGQIYYNTVDNKMYYYNGLASPNGPWAPMSGSDEVIQDVLASALVGGTGITTSYNDSAGQLTVSVDTSVIATKAYVDATAQGLDIKQSVTRATFSDITLSGSQPVDGVTYGSGVRVLVAGQADASQNGIYVTNSAGAWTRASDANVIEGSGPNPNLTRGAFTFVEVGTYAGKGFVVSEIGSSAPGVYYSTWTQFSETGNYISSVGDNLSVSSNQLTLGNKVVITDVEQTLSGKTLQSPTITANVNAVSYTITPDEIVTLDGVTSNIQTQLDSKMANNSTVVARKYSTDIGDGTNNTYTVTHGLGNQHVVVQVYDNTSPYALVETDVEHLSSSAVTIKFAVAPASGAYKVIIVG